MAKKKKDNNEFDDEFGGFSGDSFELSGEDLSAFFTSTNHLSNSQFISVIMTMMSMPRPFGMIWHDEVMERFLESRGYILINKHSNEHGRDFKYAVKKGEDFIPEMDSNQSSNVISVFEKEVQTILMDWLLELGKNYGK